MPTTEELVDQLSGLTVLEISELVKALEDKWGVSAAAPAGGMMMPMPAAGGGGDAGAEAAAEEKTEFDIVLDAFGDNKIAVIKEVRGAVPGLGLGDAKKLVEEAPSTIREAVPKEEAEEIKKKLEEAGAKITLK